MQELQILEAVINKSLEKGVFNNCKEIASVLQALQTLAMIVKAAETQVIKNEVNGVPNTTN
jgi:hypothetical protein